MTTFADVLSVIGHVARCTGDPEAWRSGLDPAQTDLTALGQRPEAWEGVVEAIRRNHPTLFDPASHAPIGPGDGAGASAINLAETALANQNSAVALLDLHVVTAILSAHAVTADGTAALDRLQADVENAVRARTDLDTPAGARDFQRYLIGKLREIGTVIENASLDAVSRAGLASAWSALYRASATPPSDPSAAGATTPGTATPGATSPGAAVPTSGGAADPAAPPPAEAYGAGDPADPYLDPYRDSPATTAPASAAPAQSAPAAGTPVGTTPVGQSGGTPVTLPSLPTLSMPAVGSAESGLGTSPTADRYPPASSERLRDLVADPNDPRTADPDTDPDPGGAEDANPETGPSAGDGAQAEPAEVTLPDGDVVTVADGRIAAALTATLAGTPITDAFRQQGIVVPAPDTPIEHPLDPAKLRSGDIAVFTDRLAVALDGSRAWFDGQLQPIANVGGPNFLGWQPLTAEDAERAPAAAQPGQTPAPTRPAT